MERMRVARLFAFALMAGLVLGLAGCITVVSRESAGKPIPGELLGQIQPGVSTKEWVLATLGAPTIEVKLEDGVGTLEYDYVQRTRTGFKFLFLIDSKTSEETTGTLHVKLKDGIVQR